MIASYVNLFILVTGLFLFAFEIVLLKKVKGKKVNLNQSILNIGLGMIERLIGIITFNFGLVFFTSLLPFRFIEPIANPYLAFGIALFGVDLMWYIYHRISHRVSLIWAAHLIHHQSKEYNFSVNFAISPFGFFVRIFVYGLLVLIGIPPEDIIIVNAVNAFYQYLLHSELWPEFKGWEKVFVTPKFHQIHHSSVHDHLDTNYGGMFTIWDRMFGTFHTDNKKITYGLTKPIENRDPFHLQIIFFLKLIDNFRIHSIKRALALLVKGPEAQTPDLPQLYKVNISYTFPRLMIGFSLFGFGYASLSLALLPLWISLVVGILGIVIYSGISVNKSPKNKDETENSTMKSSNQEG
jgi:sterol desaturase/sphingolipid hydroxylase (fatty acid hydroxylase superfamily)